MVRNAAVDKKCVLPGQIVHSHTHWFLSSPKKVYLDGSMRGELTIRVDNDGVSIRTFFNKLIPRFDDCSSQDQTGNCTVKVDTKKLSTCLQWQTTMYKSISSALLCMVENEMLLIHVILKPASVGFFTYYVPVHFISNSQQQQMD
mmetsp:Transcript_23097/g.53586  ORF Transcript_23097/g.53586 Transcript_23097/m.53586 type:complete len:145 (-) Transcript_23097:609-1043(-)